MRTAAVMICLHPRVYRLAAAIKLRRLPDALEAARALGTADAWQQVAAVALQQLDVRLAVAAYRQVSCPDSGSMLLLNRQSAVPPEDMCCPTPQGI